jgi:hypothetical protein
MRELIKKFWEKIRWPLFLIIWTAGIIGYMQAIPIYQEMRKEADRTWNEHLERIENKKDNGVPVEETKKSDEQIKSDSETVSQVAPVKSEEQASRPAPASGIEKQILDKFQNEYEVALAIARAESGLRPDAQGFNCYYNGVSQSCRKGDESRAWSTDCGLYQINVKGTTCPAHLFDPSQNIQIAFEKYQKRNWQPWSAWKSGKYLAFMN